MDNERTEARARQTVWIEPLIKDALDTALRLRRWISSIPDRDVRDIETKARLLAEAEESMELVKLGSDLLIATALCDPRRQALLQGTIHLEYTVLVSAYQEAREQRFTPVGQAESRAAFVKLRQEVDELLDGRRPFQWPIEFPEVFIGAEEGFAAIVSNPPFQGGKLITGSLGTDYREYLVEYLARGQRGNADLCAYFFLRASQLVRGDGQCGLLATNTIAQGDTREVGLDQLMATSWTIPRAVPSRKWPGTANLEVSHVWLREGDWRGSCFLDDVLAAGITPLLTERSLVQGKPHRLISNVGKSFIGSYLLGIGFVLTPKEWWLYERTRPALYTAIARMERVLVRGEVSSHLTFCWRASKDIFSHMLIIWAIEEDYLLTLLQSSIHGVWTLEYASTLGKGIHYTPSDCFDTFPFPNNLQGLDAIGEQYHQHRQSIMLARREGLTKTYNRFHDAHETSEDTMHLRELHKEMDEAVAHAYGWDDLDLGHGFHETKQGLRYMISEAVRREVLGRLLKLNHERYAEEVAQGLHEKGTKARKKGKRVMEEKARYAVGQEKLAF